MSSEISRRLGALARRARRAARVELWLFLLLWCAYGACIDSRDLEAFNLQQTGVEALAERGTFYLEGSAHPRLQARPRYEGDRPLGDSFLYDGHKYLSKQPGQVLAGALAYLPLRALGVSYVRDYLLASALVTFLTASLAAAAACVALMRAARLLAGAGAPPLWPLACALAAGLGTGLLPYAGVAHHDALATAYLTAALYLVLRLALDGRDTGGRPSEESDDGRRIEASGGARSPGGDSRGDGPRRLRALAAGLLLGLTLTTSMLPLPAAAVVGVYFISLGRARLVAPFLAGGLLGLAPALVFNYASFGNPLLAPNVAGNYRDTYPALAWDNFAAKSGFYLTALTLYAAVCWAGLAGLIRAGLIRAARGDGRRRRAWLAVLLALAAQAAYVASLPADGGCQYGPRYLLPAMPLACLGLAGLARLRAWRAAALAVASAAGVFSLLVNLAGALFGVMYCTPDRFGAHVYLAALLRGGADWPQYPLAAWLAAPLALSAVGLFVSVVGVLRARPA